jgi:hypothetical protein
MAAPQFPELPGQTVGVDFGQTQVDPTWYLFFKKLIAAVKFAYDFANNYVPPGHDDTKSDVIRSINSQTGTTYTFVLSDSGKWFRFSNSSAVTVTVPPHSSVAFEAGTQFDGIAAGTGAVSFAAGSGVTINSFLSNKKLAGQYAGFTLVQSDTIDTWDLVGNLVA